MSKRRHIVFSGLFLLACVVSAFTTSSASAASLNNDKLTYCILNVIVETRNSAGTVVGTEYYLKEFVLQDGGFFTDDFSTRTRFKFMDATMQTIDGDSTINVDWFADVSVFNSVDVSTSVTLGKGRNVNQSQGRHTFYTSGFSVRTTYFLECSEL